MSKRRRRKDGVPGTRKQVGALAGYSRAQLEALAYAQDEMLGARNVVIEDMRRLLPGEEQWRGYDLLLSRLPLREEE